MASIYRDAVTNDGRYVLSQVVSYLYKGGNKRPDIYLRGQRSKNYNAIFSSSDQRRIIEESGFPESYNIEEGVHHFDVSILALLAEHTCELSSFDSLLLSVKKIRDLRNNVSHPSAYNSVNDRNIGEKLQELEEEFLDIIDKLDNRIEYDISYVKSEVERRMRVHYEKSGIRTQYTPQFIPSTTLSRTPSQRNDSEGMPTWGKVLLGTAVGVGVLGVAAAMANDSEEEKKRENRKKREEECAIM